MECPGNNVELLFSGKGDELDGVAGNADSEVCVFRFVRMFHSVDQFFPAEDVDVQVMCSLIEVTVHNVNEVFRTFSFIVAQCARVHGLGIGNTVERPFIRHLGNGVERSEKAVRFSAVARVCARCERCPSFPAVRQHAREAAVYDVGRNRQDRRCRFGVAVRVSLFDVRNKFVQYPYTDIVGSVVVVAVFREVSFHFKAFSQPLFVADDFDLCVLNSRQGIDYMGETGNTRCERAAYVRVDERHFGSFIVVLVVHVMNRVEDVDINVCQPVEHELIFSMTSS